MHRRDTALRGLFRLVAGALGVAAGAWLATGTANAQEGYPNRPLTLVVPFAAGNVTDSVARLIGDRLARSLGQAVVVENRPGASGGVGMTAIAKAAPDGYTIGLSSVGPLSLNPALYSKLAYDPAAGFTILSVVYRGPYLVLVDAASPYMTLKDLVQASRASPRGLDYASPGAGSMQHLTGEIFARASGASFTHVPNKGSGQAASLLLGKHVPVLFEVTGVAVPFVRSGQMRALGISSAERLPSLPNVPTIAESGYPNMTTEGWLCMVAPAGLPAPLRQRLGDEIRRIMGSPEVRARVADMAGFAETMTPEQSAIFVREETLRWGEIIRAAGVKLD